MIPKLSVITINLNNAKGLRKTLVSVLEQSYSNFEYIIIDGGSSDASIEIIKEFENLVINRTKDTLSNLVNSQTRSNLNPPISYQWLSEHDKGIYHAMNKGIARSRGEYCFFLNSGDYFVSNAILLSVFSGNPSEDIVFGNLIVCLNEKIVGKIMGKVRLSFFDLYKSDVVKHQSAFIKRSLFKTFGLYTEDLRIVADWEFFLKTLGFGDVSYKYINVDIAYFDNNGLSNNSEDITKTERKQIIEKHIPCMMQKDYQRLERFIFLEPAFQFRLTTFLLRFIAKLAKVFGYRVNRNDT